MKRQLLKLTAIALVSLPIVVGAQSKQETEPKLENTLLEQLIEATAKKIGKKIVVDPRVRTQVIVYGISNANVSYKEFLAVLSANNLAAVESEGVVYVLPVTYVRFMPIPTVSGSKQYDDNRQTVDTHLISNLDAGESVRN